MNRRGFTLIELLVVVAISVLVFGLAIASFNGFNRRERLKQAALNFKSTLRFAQSRASSAEKPSSGCTTFVGFHITFADTNSYTIQHECSEGYVGTDETTKLPVGITFSSLPTPFTFETLTHVTSLTTDQAIQLTNTHETYMIQITTNGEINDLGFQ